MQARSRMVIAVTVLLLCGCKARPSMHGPLLGELEDGKVHVQRLASEDGSDIYEISYKVDAPLDAAWDAPMDVAEWLAATELIADVRLASGSGGGESHYEIQWARSRAYHRFVIHRSETRRMIDIRLAESGDSRPGEPIALTIKMRSFLEGSSTLVEAKMVITPDLLEIFNVVGLFGGGSLDEKLYEFAEDLAEKHRSSAGEVPAQSGRVHVICVGINGPEEREAWNQPHAKFAEADARAFTAWARAAFPSSEADGLIRPLIGSAATSEAIATVLDEIRRPWGDGPVRLDDTVLFYVAGQLVALPNLLSPGKFRRKEPRLLTYDAVRDRYEFTTINLYEILDALRDSRAGRCLLVCDGCITGGSRVLLTDLRSRPGPTLDLDTDRIGRKTVICAAGENRTVAEHNGHGILTRCLLKELESGDTPGISPNELHVLVKECVRRATDGIQWATVRIPPEFPADEPIIPGGH